MEIYSFIYSCYKAISEHKHIDGANESYRNKFLGDKIDWKQTNETLECLQLKTAEHLCCMMSLLYILYFETHELYTLVIRFLALGEDAVIISKQHECLLFIIRTRAISQQVFFHL